MDRRRHPIDFIGKMMTGAVLAAALVVCASPAFAQDAAVTESEADTPWYEAFTLSMDEAVHPELGEPTTFTLESSGGRWGITLGFDEETDTRFQREDVSAGAYVNLGSRIRLGGQVRIATPESEYFDWMETEERQPEVKFESALRF